MTTRRWWLLIVLASGCVAPAPLLAQGRFLVTVREAADTGVVVQRARRLGHQGKAIANRIVLVTEDPRRGRRGLRDSLLTLRRERRTSHGAETMQVEEDIAVPLIDPVSIDGAPAAGLEAQPGWNIQMIGAPAAWELGADGRGIVTASIDGGGGFGHPGLNLLGGFNAIAGADTAAWKTDPNCNGHGTHVSGTMSGTRASGVSVAPASQNVQERVFELSGSCVAYLSTQIRAMQHAASTWNARVFNISIGNSYSPSGSELVRQLRSQNRMVCGANGNNGTAGTFWPASDSNAVGVAAVDAGKNRASFSQWGPTTDFAAPGVSINSTMPGGGYGSKSGTSMATPHVCGAIAALLSVTTSVDSAVMALRATAEPLGNPIPNDYTGYGLIRVDRAVAWLRGGIAASWTTHTYAAAVTDSVLAICVRPCAVATSGPISVLRRSGDYVVFTSDGDSRLELRSVP